MIIAYRKIIITVLAISSLLLVLAFSFLSIFFSNEIRTYTPSFKQSPLELVTGEKINEGHLFYKTDSLGKIGEPLDKLEMIFVTSQEDTKQNKIYRVTHLDNLVDAVQPGYVTFKLPLHNFDCFAVYINEKLTPYQPVDFDRLPTPSDAWLCSGYDFKNYKPQSNNP